MTERFNGYENKETWAVHLHLSNDKSSYEYVMEAMRGIAHDVHQGPELANGDKKLLIRHQFEDWLRETMEALWETPVESLSADSWRMILDVGSLWRVNWREVAEGFLE